MRGSMLLQENGPELAGVEQAIFSHLKANSLGAVGNEVVFTLSITPAVYLMNSAAETTMLETKRM